MVRSIWGNVYPYTVGHFILGGLSVEIHTALSSCEHISHCVFFKIYLIINKLQNVYKKLRFVYFNTLISFNSSHLREEAHAIIVGHLCLSVR